MYSTLVRSIRTTVVWLSIAERICSSTLVALSMSISPEIDMETEVPWTFAATVAMVTMGPAR